MVRLRRILEHQLTVNRWGAADSFILVFVKGLTDLVKFTNTVDIIYAAWPAFMYTNPAIGRYLLEPVLAYQAANPVQSGYSIHDIGELVHPSQRLPSLSLTIHTGASPYPKVTGPSNCESPVAYP